MAKAPNAVEIFRKFDLYSCVSYDIEDMELIRSELNNVCQE